MDINEAYLVVKKPELVYSSYLKSPRGYGVISEKIRKEIPYINPNVYRGISRNPIEAFVPSEEVFRSKILYDIDGIEYNIEENALASLRMMELEKDLREKFEEINVPLIYSLEQATEIYGLLDEERRNNYEIIRICRKSLSKNPNTLGFDIGYWGGDNFSIICDSSIMPRWHPPAYEDLQELSQQLIVLNRHMLFEQVIDAQVFRTYYRTKEWAEKESNNRDEGDFFIIRIDDCKPLKQEPSGR